MAARNLFVYEMAFRVQRLIRLCDVVVLFLVCCYIDIFIRNPRFIARLVHLAVGGFDEAVVVDSCKCCQRVNQADVRAFRCFNGTHSAVVRMVYVAYFEARAFPGKTAGTKRGKPALMRQLGKRVVLVHELRKLGAAEELLDSRRYGAHVNECLRRNNC